MGVKTFVSKLAPSASVTGKQQMFVFDTLAEAFNGNDSGDIAVFVDTCQLRIWNGTRWCDIDGGASGTTTLTDNTATALFTVAVPAVTGAVVGGIIEFVSKFVDDEATDVVQVETGIVPFALLNESGTVTSTIIPLGYTGPAATDIASDVGGGTFSNTWSISVASLVGTIKVAANTGFTPAGGDVQNVSWRVRLIGGTGAAPVVVVS